MASSMNFWIYQYIDDYVQQKIIIQWQLQGYKAEEYAIKYQKTLTEALLESPYNKSRPNMIWDLPQIIRVALIFAKVSRKYYDIPNG